MTLVSNYFVSIVVPLADDADILPGFADELVRVVREHWLNHEIVFVDDGSRDGTATAVRALLERHECLRFLRLSRRFGVEIAISAGLDTVIGDVVVVIQPESDPPAMVPRFVEEARASGGIVFGVRSTARRESSSYALGRRCFHAMLRRLLGVDLPERATLFVAMTRQAMNAVAQIKDKARAVRVLGNVVGFQHAFVTYTPVERRAEPRRTGLVEGLERGIDLIVTHSTRPLRLLSIVGVLLCVTNLLYVVYIVLIYLFKDHTAEGWTTQSLHHTVMFAFLFAILAGLCEYVGRLLTETRDRPLYFVAEERSSTVMIRDEDRRNVVLEST